MLLKNKILDHGKKTKSLIKILDHTKKQYQYSLSVMLGMALRSPLGEARKKKGEKTGKKNKTKKNGTSTVYP